jgi:hypothetical protein
MEHKSKPIKESALPKTSLISVGDEGHSMQHGPTLPSTSCAPITVGTAIITKYRFIHIYIYMDLYGIWQ